jgi:hypothetical protein
MVMWSKTRQLGGVAKLLLGHINSDSYSVDLTYLNWIFSYRLIVFFF